MRERSATKRAKWVRGSGVEPLRAACPVDEGDPAAGWVEMMKGAR